MKIPILRIPYPDDSLVSISSSIAGVLQSGMLATGKFTVQFEEMFAGFAGARHAIACSSGTSALELIVRGLGIEGRSIVVPTNTFLATALAVMHSGNRVIFADSDPETFALDVNDVRRRLQDDTAAIVLVHIGGVITPAVRQLQQLCAERGLSLIEDCAHAHGCTFEARQAGTLGVAGAFSFFPTKVLTTGEGGMVTTNDDGLAAEIRMLRNHGKDPLRGNRMSRFGYNHRISEITAVLGVDQMARADQSIAARQRVAKFYDDHLQNTPGVRPLKLDPAVESSYYKYILHLENGIDRTALKDLLKTKYNVALTGEVYADLCHTEPLWERVTLCGQQRSGEPGGCSCWPRCSDPQHNFPGAEHLSGRHICLPVYADLSEAELRYIVDSLQAALAERITASLEASPAGQPALRT